MNVRIQCDRCGKLIYGIKSDDFTGGFYVVDKGYWQFLQRWEEKQVCDGCIHSDPKYIKIYGTGVISGSVN